MDNWPEAIQDLSVLAVAFAAAILAVWRYMVTKGDGEHHEIGTTGQVVAASFVDSRLLKELIDTLRETQEEYARISSRNTRAQAEARESMIELTEAVRLLCDAQLNLVRFMNREKILHGEGNSLNR